MNQVKKRKHPKFMVRIIIMAAFLLLFFGVRYFLLEGSQGSFGYETRSRILQLQARLEDSFSNKEKPNFDNFIHEENEAFRSYSVVDLNSDQWFLEKATETANVPASLTKLFVATFVLTLFDADEIVVVDNDTLSLQKPGASSAGLCPGEYTVKSLIQALLIPSGNDAAYALSVAAGRKIADDSTISAIDADAQFLTELSNWLTKEGYSTTVISDSAGDSPFDETTHADLIRITKAALQESVIAEAVKTTLLSTELPDGQKVEWKNTNEFINPKAIFYNPRITGVKTGSLDKNYNLILRYQTKELDLLVTILGQEEDKYCKAVASTLIETIEDRKGTSPYDRITDFLSKPMFSQGGAR